MAQHYPTVNFKQKRFRVIENGIDYAFKKSRGLMKTSMSFQYIGEQEGNSVYLIRRKIPTGIIWGSEFGDFEVHYNSNNKQVVQIYLVA
jgi:hypothetical protein